MKTRISLLLSSTLMLLLACNSPDANSQSLVQAVERAKQAVVMIRTFSPYGNFTRHLNPQQLNRSGGSGIIIDKDNGYILTNYHVIADEEKTSISVILPDGRIFNATIVSYDHLSDLAVLKITPPKDKPLPEIEWGDSENMQIGESAIAIGYPWLYDLEGSKPGDAMVWGYQEGTNEYDYGLLIEPQQPTVSVGIVSATDKIRLSEKHLNTNLIQTDAALNPGNSGGALVNKEGQLIGINTFIQTGNVSILYRGSEGVGFAISANEAKTIYDQLIEFGYVIPVYLGFEDIRSVTLDLSQKLKLSLATTGVYVSADINEHSPAFDAGIRKGDVITKISGHPIKNDLHFKAIARLLPLGKKVTCIVIQDDKHKTIVLEPMVLGTFTMSDYTAMQPDHKTLKNYTRRGVIVTHVIPDSVLEKAGLERDDLIYQINHRNIHSLEDFRIFIEMLPRGKTIPMRYHIERRIGQNSWYRFIDFDSTME